MYKKLKSVQKLYKFIRKNPDLHWLSKHYPTKDENPLDNYLFISIAVKMLLTMEFIVISLVGFAEYAIISYSVSNSIFTRPTSRPLILIGVVVGACFLGFFAVGFDGAFRRQLMETWIEKDWYSKHFFDDVRMLGKECSGKDCSLDHTAIKWLAGNGSEIYKKSVPAHVKERCRKELIEWITKVKTNETTNPNGRHDFEGRAWIKQLFEMEKRFKVLDGCTDVNSLYVEVERILEKAKEKQLQALENILP